MIARLKPSRYVVSKTAVAVALACCTLAVESCSGRSARKNIEPVYDPDTGRLRQLRYDSNAEFYQADLPTCAEEDTDGDGVIDKWEFYEAGRLASVAFDSMHRGRPGRRLTYSADGSVRIEVDPHGTGRWSPEKK